MKKPWAYLNENDPKAAAWLRELIRADVIVRGDVDERDIREVRASDLVGFTQCHFFAGIGGWSYALRLAGWPDTEPVWSGSCPCQPFSAAGKGGGTDDERHLWPAFHQLIAHARPAVVFGEQVASPAGLQWLAAVQTDLEASEYAVGVADLPAACVGAPHIRQRLWWLAESVGQRRQRIQLHLQPGTTRFDQSKVGRRSTTRVPVGAAGNARRAAVGASHLVDLGVAAGGRCERLGIESTHSESVPSGAPSLSLADARRCGQLPSELGNADGAGSRRNAGATAVPVREIPCERDSLRQHAAERVEPAGDVGHVAHTDGRDAGTEGLQRSGEHGQLQEDGGLSFWSDCDWIPCRDGKSRPVEPGTFPLAHGISGRVGLLRGYGNAIVPQVAAQFIGAYIDTLGD